MKREYAEYLLKKTKEDYNKAALEFSKRRQRVWEEMQFLFEDYLIPGEKVLDLGCGNGRFFELFYRKNVNYFGVDFSERLIEIAKEKYGGRGAKFQVADALTLPFPDNFFDKVYSIAVLHHIPSKALRQQFLKETQRLLKPEGLLLLTCWNLWGKSSKRRQIYKVILLKIFGLSKMDFKDVFISWMNIPDYYFHCFTKRELNNLVKGAGFKIKDSGKIVVPREKRPNSNFYIIAEK